MTTWQSLSKVIQSLWHHKLGNVYFLSEGEGEVKVGDSTGLSQLYRSPVSSLVNRTWFVYSGNCFRLTLEWFTCAMVLLKCTTCMCVRVRVDIGVSVSKSGSDTRVYVCVCVCVVCVWHGAKHILDKNSQVNLKGWRWWCHEGLARQAAP